MHSTYSLSTANAHDTASLHRTDSHDVPAHVAVDSADLLQGQKAVQIHHNGSVYRLQATKLGKLILTK
ncbi:hemin uptake protein hemP [Comamonas sp. BIGb0124]|uniref:hemin uptake protein HemP n=1 Tax=Comamonas sp. BIGb0124 TaxID=2485130 RepID=UPI000F46505F|nr:hemin uptake protein HemP [Comamonas sp. BIGb0124]ROR23155.1 hemin uptake protein hemP [Comamonas sp. BIGb0124]